MKALKEKVPDIIGYSLICLFGYAAFSKLFDYENFLLQLQKSPILSDFAKPISLLIPIVEIAICILLSINKYTLLGLYISFSLMIMFTTYIISILNFSQSIPCSCGGILSKMGWTEHLIFNITFSLLTFAAIILYKSQETSNLHRYIPIKRKGSEEIA